MTEALIALEWAHDLVSQEHKITETAIQIKDKKATVTFTLKQPVGDGMYLSKLQFLSADDDGAEYEVCFKGTYDKKKIEPISRCVASMDASTRFAGKGEKQIELGIGYQGDGEDSGKITLEYKAKKD